MRPTPRHSNFPKPVIGIAGGIGSGKSVIAHGLQSLGCRVIDSDAASHGAIQLPHVKQTLLDWWGRDILTPAGDVDRKKVSQRVFNKPQEVQRLNHLIHPLVAQERDRAMAQVADEPQTKGVVWDTPLLFEVGWDQLCDAVIFVKAPYQQRLERVRQTRQWDEAELARRENLQMPLDKKENLADYVIDNSGEVATSLRQLGEIFSKIQAKKQSRAV